MKAGGRLLGRKKRTNMSAQKGQRFWELKFNQHLPIDFQPPVEVDNLGCSREDPQIEACASLPCILGNTASSTRNLYPARVSCELVVLMMVTVDVSSMWTARWTERSITRFSLCAQRPGPRSRRCSSGERLLVDKWLVEALMASDFGENHPSHHNLRYSPCSST
jgi:hypothetical protein